MQLCLILNIFLQYPLLYCDNFIRRGRGVLLYGPSGCGKTFIGKVLAAQCNFNVIFVKVSCHLFLMFSQPIKLPFCYLQIFHLCRNFFGVLDDNFFPNSNEYL